ncbi:hypothetical protein QTA58_02505 [Neorhizobium sp. CSC1952]|nr:hypothetical protein [Rhizobium sp. CSC1952]WJR67656.1 hypothetical protein QTA58_02505 [Rhizobium sp. CSC1952]
MWRFTQIDDDAIGGNWRKIHDLGQPVVADALAFFDEYFDETGKQIKLLP